MSICIENYLQEVGIWPSIVKYVLEHPEKYPLVPTTLKITTVEEQVFKTIKKLSKRILTPQKEHDNFRKAITSIFNGETSTFNNDNMYRLLFVLELPDDTSANSFLMFNMNRNELSARSMDEFIIICALRLKMTWEETSALREEYNSKLLDCAIAPKKLIENQTLDFYQNIIEAKIKTKEDLKEVLSDKRNLSFWAKTRNTHYFALFSSIQWTDYNSYCLGKDPLSDITLYNMCLALANETGEKYKLSVIKDFQLLFGLHSVDDPDDLPTDSFLTEEEINILSKVYPSVFMTYNTYNNLVKRKRNEDISAGTYILRMLEEMDPGVMDLIEESEYVDFANKEEFLLSCDNYLIGAGFPVLRANNIFNKLILDIYDEVLTQFPQLESSAIKAKFFEKLRYYLKQIAALY